MGTFFKQSDPFHWFLFYFSVLFLNKLSLPILTDLFLYQFEQTANGKSDSKLLAPITKNTKII